MVKFKSGYLFSICSTFARFFLNFFWMIWVFLGLCFFSIGSLFYIPLVSFVVLVLGLQHDCMTWQSTYRWNSAALGIRLEKVMAPHSSTLAWKIHGQRSLVGCSPWGHEESDTTWLWLFTFMRWRRKWQPTPVFLPGESQGRGSLVGCRLWGRAESDTTEATQQQQQVHGKNLPPAHSVPSRLGPRQSCWFLYLVTPSWAAWWVHCQLLFCFLESNLECLVKKKLKVLISFGKALPYHSRKS